MHRVERHGQTFNSHIVQEESGSGHEHDDVDYTAHHDKCTENHKCIDQDITQRSIVGGNKNLIHNVGFAKKRYSSCRHICRTIWIIAATRKAHYSPQAGCARQREEDSLDDSEDDRKQGEEAQATKNGFSLDVLRI